MLLCFSLDVDYILSIFNYYYLSILDLDTDNSVYSSGGNNRFYDPVTDSYRPIESFHPQGENPQGGNPQGGNHQGGNSNTNDTPKDTDKLADFIDTTGYNRVPFYRTGIRFRDLANASEEKIYYSRVMYCVKSDLSDTVIHSRTLITPELIHRIRSLHKDYDLSTTIGVFKNEF